MKKNFFKKLSFVLASAMVLTAVAPASGVFAAKAPKLNSTDKYLHLGREKENEYNFNIANKKSGWKYEWTSANEDVVKVNKKNGVAKATGVGSTKVSVVITDKDGEEVDELKAKVTVRDNIATVKVSNAPTEAIAVGAEYDFNRSFVTESGSTKKTSSITRWTVDGENASITADKGVFTAKAAGEYTVTARSFQSKAKYESWLADAEKYAGYVLDTDSTKVKVAPSMVKAEQVDLDTFKVTFDSAMVEDDVKAGLNVYNVVGTTKVDQLVKEIKLDETGTVATVDLYLEFTKGSTYVAEYKDMEPAQFVAATTNYTDVVRMEIDQSTVVAGEETELTASLYNAAGVNITDGLDKTYGTPLKDRVSFDESSASDNAYLDGNNLLIFEIGKVTTVTATFHTLEFDNTGKEIGNIVVQKVIKGVDEKTIGAGSIKAYTIVANDGKSVADADWKELKHQVAVNQDSRVVLKLQDPADEDKFIYSDNDDYDFDFTSSNEAVLIVDSEGILYPVKAGAVIVIVKYNNVAIGTLSITVVPESKAAFMTLNEYKIKLSNYAPAEDSKDIKINVKDQYNGKLDINNAIATFKNGPSDAIIWEAHDEGGADPYITFSAENVAKGNYVYTIKANDVTRDVTITVGEPIAAGKTPDDYKVKYEIVADGKLDLAVSKDTNLNNDFQVKVVGFVNGYAVTKNVLDGENFILEVTDPKKDGIAKATTNGAINLYSVSGGAISKDETGTYKLVAKQKIDNKTVTLGSSHFIVEDTQAKPSLTIKTQVYEEGDTIETAVEKCFAAKIDGEELDIVDIDYIGATSNSKNIKTITVKQTFDGKDFYILHEVKVNRTITLK
jgi:hypothetical protein